MKERGVLKLNVILIVLAALTALSSIQLELASGDGFLGMDFDYWVWGHVVVCLFFLSVVLIHFFLHCKSCYRWFAQISHLRRKQTRWLVWLSHITFLTGILSAILFGMGHGHSPIGGVHGKFGLVVIVLSILHVAKRAKWFRGRLNHKAFHPIINRDRCVNCGKCEKICPAQVFTKEGKNVIVSEPILCQRCKKCVLQCPKKAIGENL